ncbi:hypothetical protein MLD38_007883 [Melastoma candidum]|uniref:Uncharacterized protein n=1 Tax=Melastoma candidum TaxID=119954 RepID=A0ACB9RS79_9MYRT|nr:hypothetical protein MLD38_007883 [Melastoma candidum]
MIMQPRPSPPTVVITTGVSSRASLPALLLPPSPSPSSDPSSNLFSPAITLRARPRAVLYRPAPVQLPHVVRHRPQPLVRKLVSTVPQLQYPLSDRYLSLFPLTINPTTRKSMKELRRRVARSFSGMDIGYLAYSQCQGPSAIDI